MTETIFSTSFYYTVVWAMMALAVVVFLALQRITAGYGMMYDRRWGPVVGNRLGWILMEAPVFVAMALFWISSPRRGDIAPAVMASLFMLHYFQRSFIFPLLIKGKGRMPLAVIAMGVIFNLVNSYMIGGWIFYVSPAEMYRADWLLSWQFIAGTLLFFAGMAINIHSDNIIRHLRKPGDTRHYIPRGGLFRYVTSANYLGEFVEWSGYALLTWSLGGLAFAVWTFANLAPRARSIHRKYISEFGNEYEKLGRRYILPLIY